MSIVNELIKMQKEIYYINKQLNIEKNTEYCFDQCPICMDNRAYVRFPCCKKEIICYLCLYQIITGPDTCPFCRSKL